ncbi:helix-turn-helix domain-containing protein [Chryseobacterium paridis]|uniref:Helix-turn-helix transcriptional regulator n=1 Tax=Chryseobacterium paridis TaxID=2800328 RepID=A0ABS1FXM1_9FLAO|nr:helix-turn-helix transcriptional regulator [Chryseobacterium paridis]MBK1897165.1 helix-turn-helix transcriptional regulator [Chryseobacterium paridis]
MFGTEIHFITFIFICLLSLILLFVSISMYGKKNVLTFDIHFLLLTFGVLSNNVSSGLLPDENLNINILSQNIIAYTIGFITIGYYVYYLTQYYKLTFRKYIHLNYVFIFLSVNLVVGFIIPYAITNDLEISRKVFLVLPISFIVLLIYRLCKTNGKDYLKANDKYERFHIFAGFMGLFSVISVPFTMLFLGDNQSVEQTFFTVGYLGICIEYFFSKNNVQEKKSIFSSALTEREKEIFNLITSDKSIKYNEISDKLNISEKTVSAHLSNIYKKVNVKSKKELVEKMNGYM